MNLAKAQAAGDLHIIWVGGLTERWHQLLCCLGTGLHLSLHQSACMHSANGAKHAKSCDCYSSSAAMIRNLV